MGKISRYRRWKRVARVEKFEHRLPFTTGLGAFAHFPDQSIDSQQAAEVSVHLNSAEFTMPRGNVLLGLAVHASSNNVDPNAAVMIPQGTATARPQYRRANSLGTNDSLILTRVSEGDFAVRWRGERGVGGFTHLEVFLAGDANGDFRVDRQDLTLIQDGFGARPGQTRYSLDADVNRDGRISHFDWSLARDNLGAATSVRSLVLTAGLSPDTDPDGNGVVQLSDVTMVGQTMPGSAVQFAVESATGEKSPQPETNGQDIVADSHGRFQFSANVLPGMNQVRVEATDRFGQRVAIHRSANFGDVILDWNASMLNVIRDWTTLSNDPYSNRVVPERPQVAARNLAMMHAAMYDAVNAVAQTHQAFRTDLVALPGTSPVAAAAAAAHRVASSLYRELDELAVWDASLAEALATVPDGEEETLGLELGRKVGDAMIAWRSTDGSRASVPYKPGNQPGDWNRTFPDFLPPLLPQWPKVTPFAMSSPDQFRAPPPPELDSPEYAEAVDEVMQLGGFGSTLRTAEETEIALFWADGGGTYTPPGHWNDIASGVALSHGNTLVDNSRLFALLNVALADAGISSWDSKYFYNFWRPIDAIRRADIDGNDLTSRDATWTPLLKTPPFPSHTSGHSTFSQAGATVLTGFFGENVSFSSQADAHTSFSQRPLAASQITTRHFSSFNEAAEEAGRSRIFGGIHFQFENIAGREAGRAVGRWVIDNLLRPRDE